MFKYSKSNFRNTKTAVFKFDKRNTSEEYFFNAFLKLKLGQGRRPGGIKKIPNC